MSRQKGSTNRRWTVEDKKQLIEEYYREEIGYRSFAQQHDISPSLFATWLKKFRENGVEGLQHSRRKVPESLSHSTEKDDEILELKLMIAEQQIEIQKLRSKILVLEKNV